MKYLLPLLLASCAPLEIIWNDITNGPPEWGEGGGNPNVTDLCTVHEQQIYTESYGYVGDVPGPLVHFCGVLGGEPDHITVRYTSLKQFTVSVEVHTFGFSEADITIIEWAEDLPNHAHGVVIDEFHVDGQEIRMYSIEPSSLSSYLMVKIVTTDSSDFNDYYVRIES